MSASSTDRAGSIELSPALTGVAPADAGHMPRWGVVALVAVVLLAMGGTLRNEFTSWDDYHTVANNPMFNPPKWDEIVRVWDPRVHLAGLWVPATYTAWGVMAQMAYLESADPTGTRLNPMVFKGGSLLAHVIATVMVYALIRRLVRDEEGKPAERWAWLGAALFGVHPLQVESVGWTSGLKDVMWGMFAVSAVYCYVRWAEIGAVTKWRSGWWLAGAGLFVLGTLSKPTAMVTPALAVVAHAVAMRGATLAGWREALRGTWPWFVWVPVVGAWAKWAQPGGVLDPAMWYTRPLVATDALAFYGWKLVWPGSLTFDYGRKPPVAFAEGWAYWTWVFPVGVAVLLWAWRRRNPAALAGGMWFVVAVSPVLGLTGFLFQFYSTVADHYVYGSMAGAGLALAAVMSRVPANGRKAATTLALVLLAALCVRSAVAMTKWRDSKSLYDNAVAVNPKSAVSLANQAVAISLGTMGQPTRAELNQAIRLFDRAIELRPEFPKVREQRATALLQLAEIEKTEGNQAEVERLREEALEGIRVAIVLSRQIPLGVRPPMTEQMVFIGRFLLTAGKPEEALEKFLWAKEEMENANDRDPRRRETLDGLIEEARRRVGR